ncbi:MAG: slipin family protein [Gammaproteobacteria bacterium]|nr:slipin family protein [Gammaproteobacteria bacterium]
MISPAAMIPLTVLLFIFMLLVASLKILREYERGVVFFLGRFQRVKGPGLIIIIPIIQVEDFHAATSQLAQTTLRSVLGAHELDEMLTEREQLNKDVQEILDKQTDAWGIKVSNVEIKHVDLDESMVRAIAKQAEAERERRAKVIHAEGELQASQKLREAADVLMKSPASMQLRYLQTLNEVGNAPSSTVVFPFPIEFAHLAGTRAGKEQG